MCVKRARARNGGYVGSGVGGKRGVLGFVKVLQCLCTVFYRVILPIPDRAYTKKFAQLEIVFELCSLSSWWRARIVSTSSCPARCLSWPLQAHTISTNDNEAHLSDSVAFLKPVRQALADRAWRVKYGWVLRGKYL